MHSTAVSVSFLLCVTVVVISSTHLTKTYSAINSIIFSNNPEPQSIDDVHSEYYYGKCATEEKVQILHETHTFDNIRGKLIVRGHVNLNETTIPNCVYIKATSPHGDMVRYNAYKFSVCIIKIEIIYSQEKFYYYYYEWFVPVEMKEGIRWDLYFYLA